VKRISEGKNEDTLWIIAKKVFENDHERGRCDRLSGNCAFQRVRPEGSQQPH
jgi:hypothetical protein